MRFFVSLIGFLFHAASIALRAAVFAYVWINSRALFASVGLGSRDLWADMAITLAAFLALFVILAAPELLVAVRKTSRVSRAQLQASDDASDEPARGGADVPADGEFDWLIPGTRAYMLHNGRVD